MATTHSTTVEAPRFTGKHARDRYLDWLLSDARFRIQQALATPPLDCEDLYIVFVADPDAAYASLAKLGPKALVAQAFSMTSYLNEILSVDWQVDDVLDRWQMAMNRRGLVRGVAPGND